MGLRSRWSSLSRLWRWSILLAAVVALWAVIGFLVAPPILRSQLETRLREATHRPASVEQVKLNPFALSLTVRGLQVNDHDGSGLLGFDELYVNFQSSSLFRRAWTFDEIHLIRPTGRLRIQPDGQLAIADLLPPKEQPAPAPEPEPEAEPAAQLAAGPADTPELAIPTAAPPKEPPRVLVGKLDIVQGRFDFDDLSVEPPFHREMTPIDIHVTRFTTLREGEAPYGFTAELGRGESLAWEGEISVNPLRSAGRLTLNGIGLPSTAAYKPPFPNLRLGEGSLDVAGDYVFDRELGKPRFQLRNGDLTLWNIVVVTPGEPGPLLRMPQLAVRGVDADTIERTAVVQSVVIRDLGVRARREADGKFEILGLIQRGPAGAPEPEQPAAEPEKPSEPAPPPWAITVADLRLDNATVQVEDRSTPTPVALALAPLDVDVQCWDSRPGESFDATVAMTLVRGGAVAAGAEGAAEAAPPDELGRVNADAHVMLKPLAAQGEVQLAGLQLPVAQPWLAPMSTLRLANGALDVQGRFAVPGPTDSQARYAGNVTVRDLRTAVEGSDDPLMSFRTLALRDLTLDVKPLHAKIADVRLDDLDALLVINADKTKNIQGLKRAPAAPPTEETAAAGRPSGTDGHGTGEEAATPAPAETAADAAPVVAIDTLELANARLGFADRSVAPEVATALEQLNGTVKGLASSGEMRLDVALQGLLHGENPLSIQGWVGMGGPGSENARLGITGADLTVDAQDVALKPFSPYSGKYAGYGIARGDVLIEIKNDVHEGEMKGDNHIVITHFTWGPKTDSPDATNLPVRLAVALLRDIDGVIDLDVPVTGRIDDPEFTYGGIIWKAILNLLIKAATSPFSLIGGLFGGGEAPADIDQVTFAQGLAAPAEPEGAKLDALASALKERPALRLEIQAAADPEADRKALAQVELDHRMLEERAKDYLLWGWREPPPLDQVRMGPRDKDRLLRRAYETAFHESPEVLLNNQDVPEDRNPQDWLTEQIRDRLLGTFTIGDDQVAELARSRANAIRDALAQRGIDPERLLVLDPTLDGKVEGEQMTCALTLTGD